MVIAFWKAAYALSADEFHALDWDGLEAMVEAVTDEDRESLRTWLKDGSGVAWAVH
jgi:hypothetical protein